MRTHNIELEFTFQIPFLFKHNMPHMSNDQINYESVNSPN